MARLTLNPALAAMSKRTSSAVFASCKQTQYLKSHSHPRYLQTAAQLLVRQSLSRMAALWRCLPDRFQQQQDDFVNGEPRSGFNWFTSQNRKLEEVYETQHLTPPNRNVATANYLIFHTFHYGWVRCGWSYPGSTTNLFATIARRFIEPGQEEEMIEVYCDRCWPVRFPYCWRMFPKPGLWRIFWIAENILTGEISATATGTVTSRP